MSVQKQLQAFTFELKENVLKKALVRAINRTATSMKAQAAREVRSRVAKTKIKVIKDSIDIVKATNKGSIAQIVGKLVIKGNPIPLIQLGARQTKRGVSVTIYGKRQRFRKAFIAKLPSKNREAVAERTSDKRLPVRELFAPSFADVLRNEEVLNKVIAFGRERFAIEFERELKHRVTKEIERKVNAAK